MIQDVLLLQSLDKHVQITNIFQFKHLVCVKYQEKNTVKSLVYLLHQRMVCIRQYLATFGYVKPQCLHCSYLMLHEL